LVAVSLLTLIQWVTRAGGEYQWAAEGNRTIPPRSAREVKNMVWCFVNGREKAKIMRLVGTSKTASQFIL
jgi:hypothetical protein